MPLKSCISVYKVPLYLLPYIVFMISLGGGGNHPHFIDEETKALCLKVFLRCTRFII